MYTPLVSWALACGTRCSSCANRRSIPCSRGQATHATLSTNEHVNYWLQFTAHPIMFNVFVWIPQHLISHHQYTNDPNMDVDVHHFSPALLSAEQPSSHNNRFSTRTPPCRLSWRMSTQGLDVLRF